MDLRIVVTLAWLSMLAAGAAFAAVTSAPDPETGKSLAVKLCANCHLVESGQEHANVDVPSFYEIANREGQTEGTIMARIVLPKHPMPVIPLTKSELTDLAAYIMTLREPE
jgi:mono/diheme cytochrome c family protein